MRYFNSFLINCLIYCIYIYVKKKRFMLAYFLVVRALKAMKSQSSAAHLSKLHMVKGEIVIELEGTVTTQPVLQHVGVSTWPGKCFPNALERRLCCMLERSFS